MRVCVCACACGGKWQRLQSNSPALSDSDEWHRPGTSAAERGCRSTSRCSAHERARIQTNPAVRPKRSEVRNTSGSERSNNPVGGDFARTRIRAVVVRGVHRQSGIFNMRVPDYHLPKYPKRKILKVKRFETGKETPSSNTLGFEIENGLARRRWPNSGRHTGACPYGWTCAPRPAASLLAAAEEEKSSGELTTPPH